MASGHIYVDWRGEWGGGESAAGETKLVSKIGEETDRPRQTLLDIGWIGLEGIDDDDGSAG